MNNKNTAAIKELFDSFYLDEKNLTSAQLAFVEGAKKYFSRNRELSDRQISVLRDIKKYLPTQKIRMSNKIVE
jgi:hypothetical protein